ncbi:MAG: DedA family protein [Candidatus Pacebacteria bacterium]|jgi:membrane-associated protein|nr:DedA family protein [Candidatus Paceibacterota bacterium]
MHTVNLLISLVEHHAILAHALIYVGVLLEGEVTVISVGILAHLGALNPTASFFIILAGAFTKTLAGYAIGKFCYERYNKSKFFRYMQKRVSRILPKFKRKPFWSIFISKFILGANHLVILYSGFERVSYRKYLRAEFWATIIWAPFMMALGYFFSYTALHVSREIWRFSMIILVLIIVFMIFDKMVGWLYELFEEFEDANTN